MAWPTQRTAILVIHGIGQQNPLDTLDGFVRGLWDALERDNPGSAIRARHAVRDMDGWTENYVRLTIDGDEDTTLDCYEYYWAHETERRIDAGEVFDWLVKVGQSAQRYYDEMQALTDAYELRGDEAFGKQYFLAGRRRFKKYWYLKHAGTFFRIAQVLMAVGDPLVSRFPAVGKPLKAALRLLGYVFKPLIVGYIGDIVIYTTTDMKSKHFEVRNKILNGATRKLEVLLTSQDPEYRRIIVAGHSLGSVIGYDLLNRLNNAMNTGRLNPALSHKITGFVTFGSPLDKVAFFFQERTPESQYVRRQILTHYHGFKARNPTPWWTPAKPLPSGIQPLLDHARWLNFWDRKDPISGPLDFYEIPDQDNRELQLGAGWGVAHSTYWSHGPMHEQVIRDLF